MVPHQRDLQPRWVARRRGGRLDLDIAQAPLAGVVLCGGASRRMGRDKALIEIDGITLLERVAGRLTEIADPVFLASGAPGRYRNLGYPEIDDAAPATGPLGGLISALRTSPHPLVAAVAVDMPYASALLLLKLVDLRGNEDAVVPVTDDGLQPLHAIYAHTALPAFEAALSEGDYALQRALARLRVREVGREEWGSVDPEGRFAFNLNRPEDLSLL